MINERILICCLARDCARSILDNIPRINELRKQFISSEVLVIENDSMDSTKEVLLSWQEKGSGININSFDNFSTTYHSKSIVNPFPGTSLYRIEKMAFYRNMYLDWLETNKSRFDVLILIDIDIEWFSIDGVVNTIMQAPPGWGGIFANGYTDTKCAKLVIYTMFHDMYAYLDELPKAKPYLTLKKLFENKKLMNSKLKENDFLSVASAFGGIGIYKVEAIEGLRYTAEPNEDKYMEAICEHIPLNISVIKRGYNNYISSQMKVYYGSSDVKIVLRNLLPLWLFKTVCLILTFRTLKA